MSGDGQPVAALEVRELDVAYGRLQVLTGINLQVARGEVLALLGTNGAGKSTLLRAISGLIHPVRGRVLLGGRDITGGPAHALVGQGLVQVSGGRSVFGALSVLENLRAGAHTLRRDRDRVSARIDAVLALFPRLGERLGQRAGALSGGEQQMLALAKALLLEPRVLLIDELSLGLAPVLVAELLVVITQLKERGVTMVIVEQSFNVAMSMADRAVFLDKGEIRFTGPTAGLLGREDLLRAVFLGSAAGHG
ncbi:MAG TPA: ABC transporter ATP-binding protein [Mycobacteriales bacterium]|jgi:branched-chain amino acid transport system ATP-binding protein|nr:ABC transporter ATP-binding protein [Mycobacteriales bacterium]